MPPSLLLLNNNAGQVIHTHMSCQHAI